MGHFITSKDIPAEGEHLKKGALSKWIGISGLVALIGIIVSAWLLFNNNEAANTASDTVAGRYAYSWLFAFAFFVSFSLGGAFWLLLHHVSNSGWGVSVRRLMENLASVFPWMGILAILFPQVQQHLFEWMNRHREVMGSVTSYANAKDILHHSYGQFDHMLYAKSFYMNLPFWLGRMVGYFVLLGGAIYILKNISVAQDNDPKPGIERLKKSRKLCAAFLPIFALTATFLAFRLAQGSGLQVVLNHVWGLFLRRLCA